MRRRLRSAVPPSSIQAIRTSRPCWRTPALSVAPAFDHFIDANSEPAASIARRIRSDGIGVLVDLNGYTTHARSEIFALRPASVQVSWLGYLGTLGTDWCDYVLTDRFVAPPS